MEAFLSRELVLLCVDVTIAERTTLDRADERDTKRVRDAAWEVNRREHPKY